MFQFVNLCILAGVLGNFAISAQAGILPGNLTDIAKEVEQNGRNDFFPGVETWQAPAEMRKDLPYYHAGYDYNHRPVMIWEAGKWDVRKYASDPVLKDLLYKYIDQLWYRASNLKSPNPDAEEGTVVIIDADEFSPAQLLSTETIKAQLASMRLGERLESHFSDILIINMSFVGETWINLIRPIAGRFIGRAEIYGPNKLKWGPVLHSKIPKDQLPPWYTGSDSFKPVNTWR